MSLQKVAAVEEISSGCGKTVDVSGTAIALFNVGGKFYATDNTCPHRQGPLGKGELNEKIVTCPIHGWQFDVTSGDHASNPDVKIKTYPVTVEGSDIHIDI